MPSWRVHRTVLSQALREVSEELGALGERFVKGLYKGVVEPDKVSDKAVKIKVRITRSGRVRVRSYRGYAKHHTVDESLIEYYYNLALYHARRRNAFLSGVALGRAIHYAQDGSVETKRFPVLNVHDRVEEEIEEAIKSFGGDVWKLCRSTKLGREASTQGLEALCVAYEKTSRLLKNFFTELAEPVDVKELRRKVRMIRIAKIWIAVTVAIVAVATVGVSGLVIAIPICIATALYRPKTYYEAMKAGLMVLKPYSFEPAY